MSKKEDIYFKEDRRKMSDLISNQVKDFLEKGNKIEVIEPGISGESDKDFKARLKLGPTRIFN